VSLVASAVPTDFLTLDAYFGRIGYDGPREPTAAVLRSIHQHHVQAIPFENLDVLLGRRINIEPDAIADKLIGQHRGGYCFEQNTLLREMLRALGFTVTPLLARVRWQVPADDTTGLTHMALAVEAEGRRWLCDVGFGALVSPIPLSFETDAEQLTTHEPRRLIARHGRVTHQTKLGDTWHDL